MITNRIIIYPKDVQRITGKTERSCRAFLKKIRKINKKTTQQFVSIYEFAEFTGLPVEEVQKYIAD